MNRKEYNSDWRYAKVLEQMDLLQIMDITTSRQHKNGTIVWKLPIRVHTAPSITKFIEVASFKTGYVRNQNSGYSNYQLNKRCESEPQYYKDYKWNDDYSKQTFTGKYQKFTTRACKLIPNEIDRLEYLIDYCLKNYYIKRANFVANGDYIPKWRMTNVCKLYEEGSLNDCGHYDRINDLESDVLTQKQRADGYKEGYEHKKQYIRDLENKLDTIQRISDHGKTE